MDKITIKTFFLLINLVFAAVSMLVTKPETALRIQNGQFVCLLEGYFPL